MGEEELGNEVACVSHFDPQIETHNQNSFSLSDRDAVCTATGPFALHGVPAFALAGSLSVTQSEEQQSRRG